MGVYAGVSMLHSNIPARGGGENVSAKILLDCCCYFNYVGIDVKSCERLSNCGGVPEGSSAISHCCCLC